MRLGAHIGIAEGLPEAVVTAKSIGCESLQIFSKSPKLWKGPPIVDEAASAFRAAREREGIGPAAVHHGYLINLATPKASMLRISRLTFVDELERAEKLGVDYLIFHPGAHLDSGPEKGVKALIESLNGAFDKTRGFHVRALIENAAGQGTAMCANFEEIQATLAGVTDRSRVGVALDTCHLFAAGVDFRTEAGYGAMVDRIRATFGLESVFAFHLNDAKEDLGSHKDRHENIGRGQLGLDGFRWLLNDRRWELAPGYLETPIAENSGDEYGAYRDDLKALRSVLARAAAPAGRAPKTARKRKGTVAAARAA